MKIIKNITLILIFTCFQTKIIFPMSDMKQNARSVEELVELATKNNLDETDDINLAAIILTTIQDRKDLKQLNNKKKEQKRYKVPTKIKKTIPPKIESNIKVQNFVRYVQNGNNKNIISILNDPEARTRLPMLLNSTTMFQLLCAVAASKKKLNEYNEDIFVTTFSILLSDEQIHQLLNPEQINKLLTKIVYRGTALRLELFLEFNNFTTQINPSVAQNAMLFLAGRGHNFMLQTLLNNPIICSKLDKNSALSALKKADAGQADRVRRNTLCTLLENDTVYNLLKNLDLNNYLSKESLQFIHKKTTKNNVKHLIKNLL